MKVTLIAFHLLMVIVYLAMGGILLFTTIYSNLIAGTTRLLMGIALLLYGSYRGLSVYRNFIREK